MSEEQSVWLWLTSLTLLAIGLGFMLGMGAYKTYIQCDAVKAGAATWVADEDGKPEFKWKVNVNNGGEQ